MVWELGEQREDICPVQEIGKPVQEATCGWENPITFALAERFQNGLSIFLEDKPLLFLSVYGYHPLSPSIFYFTPPP